MVGSGPSERPSNKKGKKRIEILIQGQDGIQVRYAIRPYVPIKKLLMKHCENKKLDYKSMRFIYNSSKLLVRRTPDELRMRNGDQIDAVIDGHAG